MVSIAPLFVPGDRPERFAKAAASGADAVIIDLEDAVAPDHKALARAGLAQLPSGLPVFVRVNAVGSGWFEEDMAAIAGLPLAGVMLAKTESAADVARVEDFQVIALIETARGLASAREIAATLGVARLAFGSIDFCADLGVSHAREALLMARSELVLASRLGGLAAPLDGVTTSILDPALIEDEARYAQGLGFGGKLCIHPAQIPAVQHGFMPGAAQIEWAKRILAAGDAGAVAVDGAMVDAPVRARARAILARVG
jgi:citrate lyase subunit beta/citryl-CoA lyase